MLAASPGVVIADYAQLLKDVAAVVRHEMQHAIPAPGGQATTDDELLSVREAATLLGVTVQTIHEHKRKGLLKYYKLGSRTYLKKAEVMAALEGQQRTRK